MKVTIPYYEIEENAWCEKEGREYYPYSTDMEYEVDVKECEFDRKDLEEIVDRHLGTVIELLLKGHREEVETILREVIHQ